MIKKLNFKKIPFFLALLCVSLSACGSSTSIPGGLLLSSRQTGDWEIFNLNVEEQISTRLTYEEPYLPNNLLGSDASTLAKVEGYDLEAAWAPSGDQIALHSDRFGSYDILLINSDGSFVKNLTTSVDVNTGANSEPDWSPDGKQIAFRSDRTGDVEIFTMNSDGSELRQLTNAVGEDWTPTWSPDGEKIAFANNSSGSWDIFSMNPSGTNLTQLTNNTWNNYLPDWSPDGKKIAFASNQAGNYDIWIMNPDGTSQKQLTKGEEHQIEPVWSPDGKKIAFAGGTSSLGWMINIIDLDTGNIVETPQSGYPSDWIKK